MPAFGTPGSAAQEGPEGQQEEPEGQQLGQRSRWIPAGRNTPGGKTPQDGSIHLLRMTPAQEPRVRRKVWPPGFWLPPALEPWGPPALSTVRR